MRSSDGHGARAVLAAVRVVGELSCAVRALAHRHEDLGVSDQGHLWSVTLGGSL